MKSFFLLVAMLVGQASLAAPYSTAPKTAPNSIPGVSGIPLSRTSSKSSEPKTPEEENRLAEQRAEQGIQQNSKLSKKRTAPVQTVCIRTDKKCLEQEARARLNQNNATSKDNPLDLNNRPSY